MKIKKITLIIVGLFILADIGLIGYKILFKKPEEKKETKVIETIGDYNYTLEDRDTVLYKEEFANLKKVLISADIDYTEYAKAVAKLYVIDLYTLNNKLNKYDVGGTEFIHSEAKDNYILKVEDTLYKYIKDNTYGNRKDIYPEVNSVNIIDYKETSYIYNKVSYDAFEVSLNWEYVTENDYDTSAIITLIKENNKLVVVEETRVD